MKGIKNKFEIAQKHMENNKFKEIENTLLDKAKFRDPVKSIEDAPPCFGIYCIRIKNIDQLSMILYILVSPIIYKNV